jgi:hypothetical protein
MWFDEIMDDCKQALITVNKHKAVFIPLFLKLIVFLFAGIYFFTALTSFLITYRYTYIFDHNVFPHVILNIIAHILVIYLAVLIGFCVIDTGTINMLKYALNDEKPRFKSFTEGVKKYLLKTVLGNLFIHGLVLVTLPITAILYTLLIVIFGTLTAGWAVIFLNTCISVFMGAWISILIIEEISPIKAMGKSLRLGKKYFKGLFVVMLASTLIGSFSSLLFGPLAAVFAGWFISGVVITYFRLVVMQIYYRMRDCL